MYKGQPIKEGEGATEVGIFVMTMFCWEELDTGKDGIIGSTTGHLTTGVATAIDKKAGCVTYNPGYAFEPGEEISCVNDEFAGSLVCTMTGVLLREPGPPEPPDPRNSTAP